MSDNIELKTTPVALLGNPTPILDPDAMKRSRVNYERTRATDFAQSSPMILGTTEGGVADEYEQLAAILEEYDGRLQWITPRATNRWDLPAGCIVFSTTSSCIGNNMSTFQASEPSILSSNPSRQPYERTEQRISARKFLRDRDKTLGYAPLDGWRKEVNPNGGPFF